MVDCFIPRVAGLPTTDSSADKNGHLCKFLKGVLKISKHFQEELCDGVTLD